MSILSLKFKSEDLIRWEELKKKLSALQFEEITLRKKIFALAFPDAKEGTNSVDLQNDWVLKGVRVINRSVDQTELQARLDALREAGINVDKVIRYKPDLNVSEYRKLNDDQRLLVEACLTIKEGSPQLKIELPKKKGAK